MKKQLLLIVILGVILGGFYLIQKNTQTQKPIGGDKDTHGCLGPAGYSWSEEVGACLREFEMTADIKRAAKLAVDSIGREYNLTVLSFNSYEEPGSYDVTLTQGDNPITVSIKNWKVMK